MDKKLPLRKEIPEEYTWRLEDIFPNNHAWEEERKQIKEMLPKFADFQGTLGKSAEQLFAALTFRDEVFQRVGKLYAYARMRHDEDVTNTFYQELYDRASQLYSETLSASSFYQPELLSIDEETIQSFLEHEQLQLYRHMFEKLNQQRPHILSSKEESLLAQASEIFSVPSNVYGVLNNADLTFPTIQDEEGKEIEITHGRFIHLMESDDRRIRKETFQAMYGTYEKFKNTFASTLAGLVKKNNFQATIRRYSSARNAALSRNYIPEQVYDQLVETVNDHLHLLHRYMRLKKKMLDLDELHMYDIYAPLVKNIKYEVTYSEAKEILLDALKPLGDAYLSILQRAFANRWIDVYENKGKRSGAYSSGVYGTNPYILLNWQDDVNHLFTLAHEFGHSVHSYYSRTTQPFIYSNYTIFVAEVASTCNEALLDHYLSNHVKDRQKQIYLLNHYLEGFRATVFRQTMFAEFEHLIHQKAQAGEALTAERLTNLYIDLNKKYFGPDVHVDPEIGLEWARIPHFYMNFYVYQYATGYSAAASLSQQILHEGPPAVDRYLSFLKAGDSDYSIELLKKAGVDMTKPDPIKDALQIFENKLTQFEQLLS